MIEHILMNLPLSTSLPNRVSSNGCQWLQSVKLHCSQHLLSTLKFWKKHHSKINELQATDTSGREHAVDQAPYVVVVVISVAKHA